jgi:hypothetical protein
MEYCKVVLCGKIEEGNNAEHFAFQLLTGSTTSSEKAD